MSKHKAVGIHCFAGGFTMGIKKVCDIDTHLETHGFGIQTAEEVVGVNVINTPGGDWPSVDAEWCAGNPRCTGFSCVTAGYGDDTHGPWAKQTRDIHELCRYGVAQDYQCIVWESVQQAYSTGRELLNHLIKDIFVPKNYRVAHLFLNAASFGNAQQRKRYFFVAYKNDRNFNIVPPNIDPWTPCLYDAIWKDRDRVVREAALGKTNEYDRDCHVILRPLEKEVLPNLPNGWGLNYLGRNAPWDLPKHLQWKWKHRTSEMPFSMHCICRLNWLLPSPTMFSSAGRLIHPDLHRPLTVGEISRIMGWGDNIPRGPLPIPQIVKGVVPSCGEWLAEQVVSYLNDEWGDQDWESSYCHHTGTWEGRNCNGDVEKVFDMTKYVGRADPVHELPYPAKYPYNVNPVTREPKRDWSEVARLRAQYGVNDV